MVEPIAHYLLPTLILLSFFPDKKRILLLSPLAILPDLDFLFGHLYLFHNLFFVLAVSALAGYFKEFSIAFYFLFSHLLLDVFGPGVGFFYPFYPKLFRLDFFVYTSPATGELSMKGNAMVQALEEATKDQLTPAVTTFGLILLILILGALVIKKSRTNTVMEKTL